MFQYSFEKRLLHQCYGCVSPALTPAKRAPRLWTPKSAYGTIYGDRFIPSRAGNSWQTKFAMITDCGHSEEDDENVGGHNRLLYSSVLRNELLHYNIEDVNGQCDKKRLLAPLEETKLFQFMSKYKTGRGLGDDESSLASYSLSKIGAKSQKLLRSQRKAMRKICQQPLKVLDARDIEDDFYLNLLDWGSQNLLTVSLGSCVYLWSPDTCGVTKLCDLSGGINIPTSVAWNKDGNLLAVGTRCGSVHVYDIAANKRVIEMEGHTDRVGSLAWNGSVLSTGSRDRLILEYDMRTSAHMTVRKLAGHLREVDTSILEKRSVSILSPEDRDSVISIWCHNPEGEHQHVHQCENLIHISHETCLLLLKVCGLKWSPDQRYLASGGDDNCLLVWDLCSDAPIQRYTAHTAAVKAIAWSPHHCNLLASGGGANDQCIRFWNTLTEQSVKCVDTGSQVCNLAWSKHSCELISTHGCCQNQIHVWAVGSGTRLKQVGNLTGHSQRVLYLAMSPDGETIATGSADETIRIWGVFSRSCRQKENRSVLNLFTSIR